jgi:hypothetical protein
MADFFNSDARRFSRFAAKLALVGCVGLGLVGCESFREAVGTAKTPPDEFAVLTKSPLVIPPDYNLRPPQPGAAARTEIDPDDQARQALFPQDAASQSAALGTDYSDGEKLLLNKANALTVDPDIRKEVTSDAGLDDEGPAFTQKVLYPAAPQAAAAPAPAKPGDKPAPQAAAPGEMANTPPKP